MSFTIFGLILLYLYLGFTHGMCIKNFHLRPEYDDLIFKGSFFTSSKISRIDCFRRCSEEPDCQLITFNPSSQSCRLHSAVLISTLITDGAYGEEKGWVYHGIDCSSIDSCSPGYVVISNSVSTCYSNGEWTSIHGRSDCALFPGPFEDFKRNVDKPIQPGVRFSVEVETGSGESNYIYFRNAPEIYIPLRMIFYWKLVVLERFDGKSVIDTMDITTPTIPENTNITVEFLFSDVDVTILVDSMKFATYKMATDWGLIEYLYMYRFNKIYKLTYD